jgi:choice-of-anchor A domain-containing protein
VACTIIVKTCGTSLNPINYTINESKSNVGQIIWFNSHLMPLSGNIPSSSFQIYITHSQIVFGSKTLAVPDGVIFFSSSATCAKTIFNTTLNRWETTIPLSQVSNAGGFFSGGLAYQIPSGFTGASSMTWSADITATTPGLQVTWEIAASNWLLSNKGSNFPTLSTSPFVPDYNGMMINPALGVNACSFSTSDHTGAPEFSGRSNLLVTGGCGSGSGNWTGDFSCAPPCVQVCQPGTAGCVALPVNQVIKSGDAIAGIGLNGVDFEVQGPISVTGDLAIGPSGNFHLSNNAVANSTLYADSSASVQIDSGSKLSGGTKTESLSTLKAAAANLASTAAGLTPTQAFTNVTTSTTVKGNGGVNVINVTGYINLGSGETLTVQGGGNDTFVFNVAGGMTLGNGSNIKLSGIQPYQVLFNFGGTNLVEIGNANTAGIFLSMGGEIQITAGNHTSEFISGSKLILDCNNTTVTAPACGGAPAGTPIVPYIQSCGGAWQQISSITVAKGSAVNLGPQPLSVGSWSWTGPNGFTSTSREIDNIPLSTGSNVFVATYTNPSGVQSTQTFTITVQ